jgi:hypothetical protein
MRPHPEGIGARFMLTRTMWSGIVEITTLPPKMKVSTRKRSANLIVGVLFALVVIGLAAVLFSQ